MRSEQLHDALLNNDIEEATRLLDDGATLPLSKEYLSGLIHTYSPMIKILMKYYCFSFDTHIYNAYVRKDVEMMDFLMGYHTIPYCVRDYYMEYAQRNRNFQMMKVLIKYGASTGNKILYTAIQQVDYEMASFLFENGATLDIDYETDPFYNAVMAENSKMVKLLLDNNIIPRVVDITIDSMEILDLFRNAGLIDC